MRYKLASYKYINKELAQRLHITQSEARAFVNVFMDIIIEELLDGKMFRFPRIGNLVIKWRKAREIFNAAEGHYMAIPQRRVLKFSVNKYFKDLIKG